LTRRQRGVRRRLRTADDDSRQMADGGRDDDTCEELVA
jgi:hypothetical protein